MNDNNSISKTLHYNQDSPNIKIYKSLKFKNTENDLSTNNYNHF